MSDREGATALQVGRIGLIGAIVGAVIGGVASVSGAYLTYSQQRDTHAADVKRATYVRLTTESQLYSLALTRLSEVAERKDQAAYTKERQRLFSSSQSLWAAEQNVYFVAADDNVSGKALAVIEEFFSAGYIPPTIEEFDADAVNKARDAGLKANEDFRAAARTDVIRA